MWSDIDHMDSYRQFSIDQHRYSDLGEFVDSLHDENLYYINIVDAAIASRPQNARPYEPYNKGHDQKLFMELNGEEFISQVWPVWSVYPDWHNEESKVKKYWFELLDLFYS